MSIYRLSFKNLKRRKLRSALTMLGIIIGVGTLVLLIGAGTGMQSYIKEQTETMMGDVSIYNSSGGGYMGSGDSYLDQETVSKIKNMSQLYDFKEEVQFTTDMDKTPIYVVGMSDWDQVKINGTHGVVINQFLVDTFGYKIGSNITIKDQDFTVTGITQQSTGMGMGIVYLDIDKALPLNDNKVSSITASARGDPETAKNDVENQIPDTMAMTQSDFTQQIDDLMNGIMLFIGAIASIGLIVGVISIVNIMLVNVTERTREIGVLKAIGFTNREVLGSILMEAGLLGFIGALIGLILAAILLQLGIILFGPQLGMEDMSLTYMLPAWLILAVVGGATVLSVLAGLYPAWRASRLNVVEALRYD
ncbi:ABC transporter permease [Methanobacterium petrolearium]|uniref:ABC transporter permease n=1 Tax=Methanobacterium petrolearium TaxID=710190 RepID=UPI001FD82468|nr:FtsX-like permease family protein [Methanobacterium petrolearium]MBP1944762.1 putative ABC transport system permease protein [Methanobacterium petrolearium]BDZ70036.1 ABC transporter permease [Methanobacterium petrolearium]